MALKDVTEISLDKSDMFQHKIELRKADNSLEGVIRCLPTESADMFENIFKKWDKARKAKNGTT